MPSSNRRRRKDKFVSSPEITRLFAKTDAQAEFMRSLENNVITIGAGVAGVGKTLLALHHAVWLHHKGKIDKIIFLKPNVDMVGERSLGFLPGELDEKVLPLLAPVLDNLEVFCTSGKAKSLIDQKHIECGLLEYMRGRSLNKTFVIYDESQNATPHGVLTMISRLGEDSKLVLLGDPNQRDVDSREQDGLSDALYRLRDLDEVGIVRFGSNDNVRNPHLINVLRRYE